MENPIINMDDLGVPLFSETPILSSYLLTCLVNTGILHVAREIRSKSPLRLCTWTMELLRVYMGIYARTVAFFVASRQEKS